MLRRPGEGFFALTALLAGAGGLVLLPAAVRAAVPADPQRGRQLAQIHCQVCHVFPEPVLMDKASWTNGALPLMNSWLGLNGVVPDTAASGLPPAPHLSDADWQAIQAYYRTAAPDRPLPQGPRPRIEPDLKQFRVKPLAYHRAVPMTTLLKIDSATHKLYVGDALTHSLEALDAAGRREFTVDFDSAPISLRSRRGVLDLTLVGRLFPSEETRGKLLRLQPEPGNVKISKVLGDLRRPTDTVFADLNGDGREDFIVCQFGNRVGRFSWFENLGGEKFQEHVLTDRPGAIHAQVYDLDRDGRPDIFVVMGQAREGVYLFHNEGQGRFTETPLITQHPAWGYTWFELVDFNQDGFIDILTTNGDNGEYSSAMRNYHGIRLYLNDGANHFVEKWFFPLNGAYKAVARDFDQDGDLDIAAISFFPDYEKSPEESFVYLENRGGLNFAAQTFSASTSGRWITMDVGDLDGDGDLDIVLGSLTLGPATIPIPATIQAGWTNGGPAVLLLDNRLR